MPNATSEERAAKEAMVARAVVFRREHMEIGAAIADTILASYRARSSAPLSDDDVVEIKRLILHHDDLKIPLWQETVDKKWLVKKRRHPPPIPRRSRHPLDAHRPGIQADIAKTSETPLSPAAQLDFNIGLFREWKVCMTALSAGIWPGNTASGMATLLRSGTAYAIYQRLLKEFNGRAPQSPPAATVPADAEFLPMLSLKISVIRISGNRCFRMIRYAWAINAHTGSRTQKHILRWKNFLLRPGAQLN